MSKIGKQAIDIPQGVTIEHKDHTIKVSGPKGTLERVLPLQVKIKQEENTLHVKSDSSPIWGTWRAHLANMVKGVTKGFDKNLELQGIGYKVQLQSNALVFQIGFSHSVNVEIPEGLACETKENSIIVKGIDKEKVGQFAAYLRSLRPPDAYKGKGIRYQGEVVKLKPGKKAGAGTIA